MARFDPKSYAKNVLRSAGYITVESVKGVNPTLTSYLTETANASKEMYDFVKDFRRKSKDKLNDAGSGLFKEVDKYKKNILDDIRTGKFYNPEREKKTLDEYMKKEGFSFDDIDFDIDENFGEDEKSSSGDSAAINNLSKTQQKLTAASTDEIVRSGRANAKMTIKSTNRAFGMVNNSLAVINTSILNLHQDLAKPLNTHIINSSNFYQAATSELATQTKYLENINRILTERYETKKKGFGSSSNYKGSAWEDVFGSGLPNFKKWGQHAKSNFMNSSSLGFIADLMNPDMMDMVSGSGAFSSPIAQLATMILADRLQNSKFGKSLNRTEDILKGGFAHMAARISARARGRSSFNSTNKYGEKNTPFLNSILSAFDILPKTNRKIDHSKYNRGPIDWDGESKKALTEVIPTQLALILSALGKEAKIFNYKTGRWETSKQISSNFQKDRKNAIISESYGFKSDITREFIDEYNAGLKVGQAEMNYRSKGVRNLERDFDTVMEYLVLKDINPATDDVTSEIENLIKNGMIDKKSGNQLIKSFNNNKGRVTTSINNGKVSNNRFLADAAQGPFGMISNGSGLKAADISKKGMAQNTILGLKDDKGHDIYWYLQNFYSSFKYIEDSISNQRFTGDRGTKVRKNGKHKYDVPLSDEVIRMNKALERAEQNYILKSGEGRDDTDEYDEKTNTWKKSSFNKTERKEAEKEKSSIFTKGIDKLNDFLSDVLFGGEKFKKIVEQHGGILGYIKDLPNTIALAIENIRNKAVDWAKDKWNKFKESDGGKAYLGSLKDQAKGIGRELGNTAKQYAGQVSDWFFGKMDERAANGGFVTKSGMVSVSEGEMIIPSEMNPFYRGKTNKSSQRAREAMNYRNWIASGGNKNNYWGSYNEGGEPYKDKKIVDKIKELVFEDAPEAVIENAIKALNKGINAGKANVERIRATINEIKNSDDYKAKLRKEKRDQLASDIKNSKPGQAISNYFNKANASLEETFGSKYKDSKEVAASAMKVIKNSLPQTMASGTIGAIIGGAMTGSGLGLLGGFAIAAGVHVLKNSDDISKKLFGDEDSNGNMTGGIIPAKAATIIKKRIPSIAKSGTLGTVLGLTGLVPGGILGGFLVGAGIDILSNNDTIKSKINDAIFGYEGVDKKRRGGIIDSFKLRVIDPVADYVKSGLGKVTGYFKEHVLDNAAKIFNPLTDWVKGKGTKMLEGIGDFIKSKIDGVFGGIGKLFHNTFGRIFKGAFNLFKGGVSLGAKALGIPLDTVGNIGDALAKHNIKAGYSTKSAKERVELMGNKASGYDRLLAEVENDPDKRRDLIQSINFFSNTKKRSRAELAKSRQNLNNQIMASMSYGGLDDPKEAKRLENLLKDATDKETDHTDYTKVLSELDSFSGISDENKVKLRDEITKQQAIIQKREYALRHFDEEKTKFFNRDDLKGLGVIDKNGNIDNKKLAQISMQSTTDLKRLGLENLTKIDNSGIKKPEEILEDQKKNDPLGVERNSLLKDVYELLLARNNHDNIPTEDKSSFDEANTNIPSKDGSKNSSDGPKEGDKRQNPNTGENEEFRGGKWVLDLSDQQTKESQREKKKEKEQKGKLYNFFLGGGLLTGLAKIFGISKSKDEKKNTIFDKIKGFLSPIMNPINSVIGSISKGFSGFLTTASPIISAIGSGVSTIASGLQNIAPIIGLGGTAISFLDSLKKHGKEGLSSVLKHTFDWSDNTEANALGYERAHYGEDEWQEDYTVKRTFKGTLRKVGLTKVIPNVVLHAPKVIKNTGKAVVSGANAFKGIAKSVANNGLVETLKNGINFVIKKAVGIVSKLTGKSVEVGAEVGAKAAVDLAPDVASKAGNAVGKLGHALRIASIALAVENGWEDAQANIGILEEPSIGEKFLSAIAGGISEFLLGLLTPDFIVDKILWIGSFFGFDINEIQQKRAAAKQAMDEYNATEGEETGKKYNTVKEYLKNTKGLYTTQDKIKKYVGGGLKKIGSAILPGAKKIGGAALTGAKNFGSWAWNGTKTIGRSVGRGVKTITSSIGENVKKLGRSIGTTLEPAMEKIKGLLQKVNDSMPYIKQSVSAVQTMSSNITKYFKNPETGISEMVNEKPIVSRDNPFKKVTMAIGTGLKIVQIPALFISAAFGKIYRTIVKPLANTIVPAITTSVGTVADNIGSAIKGDPVGLWTHKVTITNNENGIESIAGFVGEGVNIASKIALTVPTLLSFGARKVFGVIKPIAEGIGTAVSTVGETITSGINYMKAGDVKGLATLGFEGENAEGEDRGALGNIIAVTSGHLVKTVLAIPTIGFAIKNGIEKIWETKVKNTPIGELMTNLWSYTDSKKDMSGYDDTTSNAYSKEFSPSGVVNDIGVLLVSGTMRPLVSFVRVFDRLFGFFKDKKDWLDDKVNWFKNWLLGEEVKDTSTTYTSNNGRVHGGAGGKLPNNAPAYYYDYYSEYGGDSGIHVSQKGSRRKFGSSTVDDNGCGPASAATVLRAYGRGGNLDDAVSWAEARGYVAGASGVGTRASYFSDILGANGIRTSYTNRQSDIRRAIGSGNPTILLGQDSRNRSKRNSPFGPNPHYVVARGSDSRGNVWIDDPELGAPALYNKNILNKTKLGVLTGGGSNTIQADDGAVWNYLKSAGFTDAGIAGLMGNLYAESGIQSNKVEASSIKASSVQGHDYSRDHGFTYDSASYTAAVDKGLKEGAKGSPETNLNPKFGIVPEYEFTHMPWKTSIKKSDGTYFGQNGYGLAQWTIAGRKQGLYDLIKSKGVSISDKKTQLEYLLYELQNEYPGVYNTLRTTSSLSEASNKVLTDFETPVNAMSHSSTRASYGQTYYDHFTKNPPTDTSFGTTTLGEGGGQTISFPTYNLSEQQLKGVANILQHEQSGVQGRYAEASLMANLIDMKDDSRATAQNLVSYLTKTSGNWFAHGAERYNAGFNGSISIEPTALAAATDIFNNGKRTMPRYINEHDCFADLAMINGKSTGLSRGMNFKTRIANTPEWAKDRTAYKPGMPIKNVYGSNWKFFTFPDTKADPFGYTSDELRKKHGDAHYNIDEKGNVTAPAGYSSGSSSTTGYSAASSSGGTNLASILSSTFSKVFQAIAGKLTGKAGSIFKLIIGEFGNDSTTGSIDSNGNSTSTALMGNSNIRTSIAGDSTPQYGGIAKAFPQGRGTPQSAVEIAQSQLGVVEGPEGSNNGNITDYGKFMGMDAQPWCASFVSWIMDKTFNGDKNARNKALRGGTSAAVSTLWENFKSANAMTNSPQPGDVIIFKNNGASHTGLVETVNGNTITSIEGNTGSSNEYNRNGGVVARHQWTLGDGSSLDKKLTGFGRPDWGTITGTGSRLPLFYDFTGGKAAISGGEEARQASQYHVAKQIVRQTEDRNMFNSKKEYFNENKPKQSSQSNISNYSSSRSSAPIATNPGGVDATTLNTIIEYLKTIAENSKYEASLPTIVELIGKLAGITAAVNSNTASTGNQDTINSINQDLSAVMQKLETIASTL